MRLPPTKKKELTKEMREFRTELAKTISTLIVSAFSLVAALAWNNAITQTISRYLRPGSQILSLYFYAIIVTLIAVTIGFYAGKITAKYKEEEKQK